MTSTKLPVRTSIARGLNNVTARRIDCELIDTDTLEVITMNVTTLNATTATIGTLNATTGTITTLNSTTGTIDTLNSTTGTITTLNSTTGTVTTLGTTTLTAGSATVNGRINVQQYGAGINSFLHVTGGPADPNIGTQFFDNTAGPFFVGLVDGSVANQQVTFIHVAGPPAVILVPANALGFATVITGAAGESYTLMWNIITGSWAIKSLGGTSAAIANNTGPITT